MTITTTYERVEPTTSVGECFKVIQMYSSFDKSEIDEVEKFYSDVLKSASVVEVNADKGVLEKINEKQDSLRATCKAWDEAISRDGYVE